MLFNGSFLKDIAMIHFTTTSSHPESWSCIGPEGVTALEVHMNEASCKGTSCSTILLKGTGETIWRESKRYLIN